MPYAPTAAGKPRPAPPQPDTPNTGRIQPVIVASRARVEKSKGDDRRARLTVATEAVVLLWVVFDVVSRVAF